MQWYLYKSNLFRSESWISLVVFSVSWTECSLSRSSSHFFFLQLLLYLAYVIENTFQLAFSWLMEVILSYNETRCNCQKTKRFFGLFGLERRESANPWPASLWVVGVVWRMCVLVQRFRILQVWPQIQYSNFFEISIYWIWYCFGALTNIIYKKKKD